MRARIHGTRRAVRHGRLASTTRLTLELLEDRSLPDGSGLSVLPALADATGLLVSYRSDGGEVVHTVPLGEGVSLEQALAEYQANPDVLFAEPDYAVSAAIIPNDTSFGTLWGLNNTGQSGGTVDADIDAPQAWDITTGSTKVVVAVIDTGVDYRHPDLYLNIWINQGEIPTAIRAALIDLDGDGLITFWDLNNAANQGAGKITDLNANGRIDGGDLLNNSSGWENGADNDANGRVDDLIGWDFVNNDNDPFDDNNHGTHVSGTIGAIGNNSTGVAGVNWKVQIAALKFLGASGSGATSGAIAALNYAVGEGIRISNNSWGGGGFSSSLFNAINNARAAGHIFVAAAGNGGADGIGDNNDAVPSYPASYNLDNIIAVAATNRNDQLAGFSNYGATSVDLAAPGVSVLSTTPNNTYSSFSGTSMATPHVSGVVALLLAQNPSLTYAQAISRILNTVDPITSLAGKVATGGRLNAAKALNTGNPDVTGPRIVSATPNASGANPVSSVRVTFNEAINPLSFTPGDITGFLGPVGTSLTNVAVTGVLGSSGTQFDVSFTPLTPVGAYSFVIGPNISDVAGNLMDQNQDGTKGAANDTYTVQFTITGTSTFTNNTPAAIRSLATTTSTITVNRNLITADLNVRIYITHTWDSDLYIYLRGPDNTTVLLVNRRGGSGDNFNNTVLTDEAATPIAFGSAPFSGSYRPEQALSAFDFKNALGTWTLFIEDRARADEGTLISWSLTFEESATGASLPSSGERGGRGRGLAAAAHDVGAVGVDFVSLEPISALSSPLTTAPTVDTGTTPATPRAETAEDQDPDHETTDALFSSFRVGDAKSGRLVDGLALDDVPLDWSDLFAGRVK